MSLKITLPDKKEIEIYYSQYGVSLSDVARKYKTSNATVRKWMKHYNIQRKTQIQSSKEKNSLSAIRAASNDDILFDIENNMSIDHIERKYNIGQSTIYSIIERNDIQRNSLSLQCTNSWKERNKILYDESSVVISYERHKNIGKVAEEQSLSKTCVRNILVRNNIEIEYNASSWISRGHQELIDFCVENDFVYRINDRKLIAPLEIDLVIENKLCVEYNGLYWHSQSAGKDKIYHLKKLKSVESKGYRLLTVFEHYDLDIIKSMILHALNKTPRKIYARSCEIKQIDSSAASIFENQNHLMGYRPAKYYYGLFFNSELVQTMSFMKSRYDKKIDYEIIRSTLNKGTHVCGGISKLISNFIKLHSAKTLITYVDRTYGVGHSYQNTKMQYSHETPPNYYYFKNGNVYSRVSFQKHKLSKKLETFDSNKTEYQNMLDNKWNRYWDCGNYVFIYKD